MAGSLKGMGCLAGGFVLFFAMGLIAAKSLKPCDGGVFRGLDLLLKQERRAPVGLAGFRKAAYKAAPGS